MEIILGVLGGAGIGAIVAIGLYVLGFAIEIFNCACMIATCNCDGDDALPFMWKGEAFLKVLIFCAICGAVIGLIYGIVQLKGRLDDNERMMSAEYAEIKRKRETQWASEVKKRVLNVHDICEKNLNQYKPLVETEYKAEKKMEEIIDSLTGAAELQGRVNALADAVIEMGGAEE